MRLPIAVLLSAAFLPLAHAIAATSPMLQLDNGLVASPAAPHSYGAHLAGNPEGTAAMVWLDITEPAAPGVVFAVFDPARRTWSPARAVHREPALMANAYSTPQVAAGSTAGEWAVLWYCVNPDQDDAPHPTYHAWVSRTDDNGATWSAPQRISQSSTVNEFASIACLADGRWMAVWLDGRKKQAAATHPPATTHSHAATPSHGTAHGPAHGSAPGADQTLYSRILFSDEPDVLLDERVCDCCPTSLVRFDDGSARVVYRDRSPEEVRDISTLRFQQGAWQTSPQRVSHDAWKIAGCPVNGPTLSRSGPHVVAAWFTAVGAKPQVFASTSSTAGDPFSVAVPFDDGNPVGHVATAALHDGTALVAWVEHGDVSAETFILLRRLSPDGTRSVPVRLATASSQRQRGIPRLATVRDVPGAPAQLLFAHTALDGGIPRVETRLLTVHAAEAATPPCATCPPQETRGHALRGLVRSVDAEKQQAVVKHEEIPGVMPAMTMRFRLSPADFSQLEPGSRIIARMEKRGDQWWLFAIAPAPVAE